MLRGKPALFCATLTSEVVPAELPSLASPLPYAEVQPSWKVQAAALLTSGFHVEFPLSLDALPA
jgi:hypothetical protein